MLLTRFFKWRLRLLAMVIAAFAGTTLSQPPPQITVQFIARGLQPTLHEVETGDLHAPSFGHIFMIITVPTLHGPKEEAYGFYPTAESAKGMIKGPGMIRSEFRCGPNESCNPENYGTFLKRFSESEQSITIPITEEQRRQIIRETDSWNHKDYDLTKESCIDFVSAVAKDLGYQPPARSQNQTPVQYLNLLKGNIAAENRRREAARQQAPPPQPPHQEPQPQYFVRVWNVDDKITVSLNGALVFSVQDGNDSGKRKLVTGAGDNTLQIVLFNTVPRSGVSYSYMVWKDATVIAQDSCGVYHRAACNNAVYPVTQVWSRNIPLR